MTSILLIDDEPNLRLLLSRLLRAEGYAVSEAATGLAGLNAALADNHDLIVLDLVLPDIDGEHVLHVLLARKPGARVLVLSSVTAIDRRVQVLDDGAVDFVSKPFTNAEFLSRVRARSRCDRAGPSGREPRLLTAAGIRLDARRHEAVIGDRQVHLSPREFVLLAHLLHRQGQVCTRAELLADVWGMDFDPKTNIVDVCVRRLRAKFDTDRIETVRNVGYRLVA